jgi:polyhydroxybutyrate depolymerase
MYILHSAKKKEEVNLKKRYIFGLLQKDKRCFKHVQAVIIIFIVLVPLTGCGGQRTSSTSQQSQPKAKHLKPGDYERKILVGGMDRYYAIHVPTSYDRRRPTPVVLNFHGGGGSPKPQRKTSQMDPVSDRERFIAVYPQGTNKGFKLYPAYTWNAGTCCGWAQENHIDDVAYTAALLDDLSKVLNVNPKRVYATGLSNGAMMCYRLACELSDRIAAIAPVAGPMQMPKCKPSRPISIMHFHGTADRYAPMVGGKGTRSLPGQHFTSLDETIRFWLKFLRLEAKPRIVRKGNAIGEYYGPGKGGAEVVLWKIAGGGHNWPGGKFGVLKERFFGKMTQDISATNLMWEFFKKHPLP